MTKGGRERDGFWASSSSCHCTVYPAGRARDATSASSRAARSRQPESARGLAWRQFQKTAAETDYHATDDVFVYLPDQRKVRRAPPQQSEGVYVPSYTRGRSVDNIGMTLCRRR